jgi:uncharacterized glyoxalase superfamily protein PhnB
MRRRQNDHRRIQVVREVIMRVNPYLSFKGDCEEAFKLYEQCLGGQLGGLLRYVGSPLADQVPADWQDKVMHGSVTVGHQVLMGADEAPAAMKSRKASRSRFRSITQRMRSVSFTSWPLAAGL